MRSTRCAPRRGSRPLPVRDGALPGLAWRPCAGAPGIRHIAARPSTRPCACGCWTSTASSSPSTPVCSKAATKCSTELERRGLHWGIVTNKPGWLTDPLLVEVGLHTRARAVVSGDTLPERKPHPLPLLHAAQAMGIAPGECVYVGDAERDMQAAQAAGMYALVAGYGYLGDDDRAEAWFSHGWLRHAARAARMAGCAARARRKQRSGVNSPLLIGVVAALAAALIGYLVGTLRAARRAESCAASSRQRAPGSLRTSSNARALPKCSRRARRRCAPQSKARRAWRSTPTAKHSSNWRAKCSAATRPRRSASLKEREDAIAQLLEPIKDACASRKSRRRASCASIVNPPARSPARSKIWSTCRTLLQRETRNLSTALRRPEVRGRWGEITLRRVVELAGLSEHCDFTEQEPGAGAERGPLRPDLLVRMPESRNIVVDAKTPLDAYLDAVEAPDDEARAHRARPSRHAGGTTRARAGPEELLGTVRAQPGVRGAVPARRSIPVGRARRAARPASSTALKQTHHRRPRHRRSWRC